MQGKESKVRKSYSWYSIDWLRVVSQGIATQSKVRKIKMNKCKCCGKESETELCEDCDAMTYDELEEIRLNG